MAARKTRFDPDYVRQKIQTTQLVKRLQDHVYGKVTLEKSQVSAALGLIKKTLPDLAAVQHTGKDGEAIAVAVVERVIIDPKANN